MVSRLAALMLVVSVLLPTAAAQVSTQPRVRVSPGVMWGSLLNRVNPTYPPLARQARIQGTVILRVRINRSGAVENVALESGHPMLAPAAMEAVKKWIYQPPLLNGEPADVETTVQVSFTLSGG